MPSSQKSRTREAFLKLAREAGALPVSVLAFAEPIERAPVSVEPVCATRPERRVAELLVGPLPARRGSTDRVERLTKLLLELKELDAQQAGQHGQGRRASR